MKIYLFKILLLGGFFLPPDSIAAIVVKDKMVFKVSRTVFSLADLKQIHQHVSRLTCIYSDSLIGILFKNQFKAEKAKYLDYRESFSAQDKQYYSSIIDFYKLYIYARSQEVQINNNIEKYFYLMAQRNKCSMEGFTSEKTFTDDFRELVKLEIFVRSRFLPTEKNDRTTTEDIKKAVLASKSLLISIGRQIEAELYW